jgi:hypothetical protein
MFGLQSSEVFITRQVVVKHLIDEPRSDGPKRPPIRGESAGWFREDCRTSESRDSAKSPLLDDREDLARTRFDERRHFLHVRLHVLIGEEPWGVGLKRREVRYGEFQH